MGEISDKIQLFNKAFSTAWAEITKTPDTIKGNTALWLAAFIRRMIAAGADDADAIAVEAVKAARVSSTQNRN